jgi:hypothetical protein
MTNMVSMKLPTIHFTNRDTKYYFERTILLKFTKHNRYKLSSHKGRMTNPVLIIVLTNAQRKNHQPSSFELIEYDLLQIATQYYCLNAPSFLKLTKPNWLKLSRYSERKNQDAFLVCFF